jgi:hypothetical protein
LGVFGTANSFVCAQSLKLYVFAPQLRGVAYPKAGSVRSEHRMCGGGELIYSHLGRERDGSRVAEGNRIIGLVPSASGERVAYGV